MPRTNAAATHSGFALLSLSQLAALKLHLPMTFHARTTTTTTTTTIGHQPRINDIDDSSLHKFLPSCERRKKRFDRRLDFWSTRCCVTRKHLKNFYSIGSCLPVLANGAIDLGRTLALSPLKILVFCVKHSNLRPDGLPSSPKTLHSVGNNIRVMFT